MKDKLVKISACFYFTATTSLLFFDPIKRLKNKLKKYKKVLTYVKKSSTIRAVLYNYNIEQQAH